MRPKLAMGGGAKDCLPCPTACPVRAKCMHPFHVQNTPNLTWCSHQTLDPVPASTGLSLAWLLEVQDHLLESTLPARGGPQCGSSVQGSDLKT